MLCRHFFDETDIFVRVTVLLDITSGRSSRKASETTGQYWSEMRTMWHQHNQARHLKPVSFINVTQAGRVSYLHRMHG